MMNNTIVALIILSIRFFNFCTFTEISAQDNNVDVQSGKIVIASCQFPVSSNISDNYKWIKNQIIEAKLKKADVVHFAECALSGYAGHDYQSLEKFDWEKLNELTDSVLDLAKQLKIWVVLGSTHQLSQGIKPHNSLYVINPEGKIIDRYDKRFCTKGDTRYFSPGNHFVNFNLNGVNCGLLICYDLRFPELFRAYKTLNTDVIFHSFYNARKGKGGILPIIMPITAQARAATNYFYMSLTNSSVTESWPCHFITPDGLIQNKLATNIPGILISSVDLSDKYYDASGPNRDNAINGILNSGEKIPNSDSEDRTVINRKK